MIYKDLNFPLYMFNSTKKSFLFNNLFLQYALTKTTMALLDILNVGLKRNNFTAQHGLTEFEAQN